MSLVKKRWKFVLKFIVLLFFVLALARPQSGEKRQSVSSEGIELMILFDVSRSMLAEDVRPSRIELAKKEMIKFVSQTANHKIGLIAFAGSGILLSPMTTDKSAINMYLDSLTTDAVSTQGTEFKSALMAAKDAFKRGGVETEDSVVTRAIIVVSDGEDNEKGALNAAEELVKEGIHVFSLGLGTEAGGPIPIRDRNGVVRRYYKNKAGQKVITKTKGTVLKELAKNGKGSFYHIDFGSDVVKKLDSDLSKLEQSRFESADLTQYDENFQLFLLLALLVAFGEILMGERRRSGRIWRGRFEVKKD